MSLVDYQKQVDGLVQTYAKPYWSPLSNLAQLTEEVGELACILNHKYGDKNKKASEEPDDLQGEMGDILFAIICIANDQKIDLDAAFKQVIQKIQTRDANRFQKK